MDGGLRLDEADGKPVNHDATSEMEGARLRVILAFAYLLWCQRQLKDLVDSFHFFDASSAWLAAFSQLQSSQKRRGQVGRRHLRFQALRRSKDRGFGQMGALMDKRRDHESSARESARGSAQSLHFTTRLDEKRGLYRFRLRIAAAYDADEPWNPQAVPRLQAEPPSRQRKPKHERRNE